VCRVSECVCPCFWRALLCVCRVSVNTYVHVHKYKYMCVWRLMYAIYIPIYVCTYLHIYEHNYIYIWMRIYEWMLTCYVEDMAIKLFAGVGRYIYIYTYMYIHTRMLYTDAYMNIHMLCWRYGSSTAHGSWTWYKLYIRKYEYILVFINICIHEYWPAALTTWQFNLLQHLNAICVYMRYIWIHTFMSYTHAYMNTGMLRRQNGSWTARCSWRTQYIYNIPTCIYIRVYYIHMYTWILSCCVDRMAVELLAAIEERNIYIIYVRVYTYVYIIYTCIHEYWYAASTKWQLNRSQQLKNAIYVYIHTCIYAHVYTYLYVIYKRIHEYWHAVSTKWQLNRSRQVHVTACCSVISTSSTRLFRKYGHFGCRYWYVQESWVVRYDCSAHLQKIVLHTCKRLFRTLAKDCSTHVWLLHTCREIRLFRTLAKDCSAQLQKIVPHTCKRLFCTVAKDCFAHLPKIVAHMCDCSTRVSIRLLCTCEIVCSCVCLCLCLCLCRCWCIDMCVCDHIYILNICIYKNMHVCLSNIGLFWQIAGLF